MSSQGRDSCRDRHHDDLAAYALGALSDAEAAELETHLETCAACSERLQWLRPAVDLVPASVPQVVPSDALRESLMAVVREEAAAGEHVAAAGEPARRRLGSRFRLRMPWPAQMGPALAGLAAVALIAGGVGGYILSGDDSPAQEYAVQPLSPKLEAQGTVEVKDGSGTLVVDDLRPIASDEVYQVWTAAGGDDPVASSIFVVDHGGHGTAAIPDLPDGTDRVLVTLEPAGGSTTPSTAPILAASFNQ